MLRKVATKPIFRNITIAKVRTYTTHNTAQTDASSSTRVHGLCSRSSTYRKLSDGTLAKYHGLEDHSDGTQHRKASILIERVQSIVIE